MCFREIFTMNFVLLIHILSKAQFSVHLVTLVVEWSSEKILKKGKNNVDKFKLTESFKCHLPLFIT